MELAHNSPSQKLNRRSDTLKLFTLCLLCFVLIVMQKIYRLDEINPLYNLNLPQKAANEQFQKLRSNLSHVDLLNDNLSMEVEELSKENLLLRNRINQLLAIELENDRLKKLLSIKAQTLPFVSQITQISQVNPSRFAHTLEINLGLQDGIRIGDAVLDAKGVVGQINQVRTNRSQVLLITNPSLNIPVANQRNGLKGIVQGGQSFLLMQYPQTSLGVEIGDVFVTSGAGKAFPVGIPVGIVLSVDQGDFFHSVRLKVSAELDSISQLLVTHRKRLNPSVGPLQASPL